MSAVRTAPRDMAKVEEMSDSMRRAFEAAHRGRWRRGEPRNWRWWPWAAHTAASLRRSSTILFYFSTGEWRDVPGIAVLGLGEAGPARGGPRRGRRRRSWLRPRSCPRRRDDNGARGGRGRRRRAERQCRECGRGGRRVCAARTRRSGGLRRSQHRVSRAEARAGRDRRPPVRRRGAAGPSAREGAHACSPPARAEAFAAALRPLGMPVEVVSDRAGDAAEMKLLRSVFMKGLAASAIESLDAAGAQGTLIGCGARSATSSASRCSTVSWWAVESTRPAGSTRWTRHATCCSSSASIPGSPLRAPPCSLSCRKRKRVRFEPDGHAHRARRPTQRRRG